MTVYAAANVDISFDFDYLTEGASTISFDWPGDAVEAQAGAPEAGDLAVMIVGHRARWGATDPQAVAWSGGFTQRAHTRFARSTHDPPTTYWMYQKWVAARAGWVTATPTVCVLSDFVDPSTPPTWSIPAGVVALVLRDDGGQPVRVTRSFSWGAALPATNGTVNGQLGSSGTWVVGWGGGGGTSPFTGVQPLPLATDLTISGDTEWAEIVVNGEVSRPGVYFRRIVLGTNGGVG